MTTTTYEATRAEEFSDLLMRAGADLSHLRGGRGVIRAPRECHDDQRASFSVDLDRSIWYCFACARGGGVNAFAALVGERRDRAPMRPTRARPELEDYWHGVSLWPLADVVRQRSSAARSLRVLGTRLGAEHAATGPVLEHAARLERESLFAEAALDAILAEGRLP